MSETETQTPGTQIRHLMRSLDRATLATGMADGGWPYGSLVMVAVDQDGSPLLLLSDLAEHTKNLKADPRVSLLFDGTGGYDEPLTGPRATVLGRVARIEDERLAERYLRRHPSARMFATFRDFNFYRVEVERAHIVAGFGRIHWVEAKDILAARSEALEAAEAGIVEHMNADHADANQLYASVLLGLSGEGWEMTGCDTEGCDLRLGGAVARLDYDAPVEDAEETRKALVSLVRRARQSAAE
ncbi:HugZ family protein [Nisaea sp.]|uniref:HugZ family pyridoxamine 5'-phosphate oxidase n=1 Tax=Nisaea sp. TaxID=2024842 RepID=UPI003B52BA26